MTDPTPETTPTRDEAVPPGWKLVPVEPTEAMMAVGRTCGTNSANTYRAMLASAPAPASGMDAVFTVASNLLRDGCTYADRKAAADFIRSALSPAATPEVALCEDEGCPHHGRPHICTPVTAEMVTAAMRAFEPLSTVLRYREKDGWHACDQMAMRAAIEAALAAKTEKSNGCA